MNGKVLLILADALRPDSIPACGSAGFQKLFESGNYSYTAMTTDPPVTLPCHASLFYGVPAEQHGIDTNTYVPPKCQTGSLLDVLKKEKKVSAVFYSWQRFGELFGMRNTLSFSWMMNLHTYWKKKNLDQEATKACKRYLTEYRPDFCFLYLGMTDEYGHEYGWMSQEYLDCVRTAGWCLQNIMSVLPSDYSVIFTADHGGHGRDHGENVPEDMLIPMCCFGPMFEKGKELKGPVSILDIAPTVTEILGIAPDPGWTGKSLIGR